MFGTDLIIGPERPVTQAVCVFSLESILSDPENRSPIFFNFFFFRFVSKMLQQQSRGCGSRQKLSENPFTFQQGVGKSGLTKGTFLFRGPKNVYVLSSLQSMCVFMGQWSCCSASPTGVSQSSPEDSREDFLVVPRHYFFFSF